MLKWPDAKTIATAVQHWAELASKQNPEVLRIGYIGSYARGDWGVGSDLDLIIIVGRSDEEFWKRSLAFDLTGFPVPAEALVYTKAEWRELAKQAGRFYQTVEKEAKWIYVRSGCN